MVNALIKRKLLLSSCSATEFIQNYKLLKITNAVTVCLCFEVG
jgi:hypothetical protein